MEANKQANTTYTYDLTKLSGEEVELFHRAISRAIDGLPIVPKRRVAIANPVFTETDKAILRIMRDHIHKVRPELAPDEDDEDEEDEEGF